MLSFTAMGVADTLVVGRLGTTQLAGVGLATTVFFLFNSFFIGAIHGVKVVVAQATGAGRPEAAVRAAWAGVLVAIPFSAFVILLSRLDGPIFALMGGSAGTQAIAAEYFAARVWAAPFWYVASALCDYYQGTGDTRTPMKMNLVVNGLNIGLDVILVYGLGPIPAFGVPGAAWATVVACAVGLFMIGRQFRNGVSSFPNATRADVFEVARLGLPIGVRYVMGTAGFAAFTAILARMGEVELAAHQMVIRIVSVSFLPGYGLSEAACILVGQYVGAGRASAARAAFRSSLTISCITMGTCGLFFLIAPEVLLRPFRPEPELMELGCRLMRIAAIFQIFDAVAMTATGGLNGAGDTRFTMVSSVISGWIVLVPVAWLLGVRMGLGAEGAWLAMVAELLFLSVVLLMRYRVRLSDANVVALAPRRDAPSAA